MNCLRLSLIMLSLFGLNISCVEDLKGKINPQNTVFVFDMHGVVVEKSPAAGAGAVRQMSFFNQLHFAKKTLKYFFNNKNPKRSFEGVALEDREDDLEYVKQALAVMNPHVPNDEIIALLQELKSQGYDIYVCSNIGQKSYDYLKSKYPDAFTSIITARTSNVKNNYMKKTNPQAYVETLNIISKSGIGKVYDNLFFVDDKQANLDLASKTDKRYKKFLLTDPKVLRSKLSDLGIVVKH